MKIALNKGLATLVDDEDLPLVAAYRWYADLNGTKKKYYVKASSGKKKVYLHRLLTGAKPGEEADHINRNTLDNRRINLRLCTPAENSRNADLRSDNTSGYRGVHWNTRRQKWVMRIGTPGKGLIVRQFDCKRKAARAYDAIATILFGEFATLNFPEDK